MDDKLIREQWDNVSYEAYIKYLMSMREEKYYLFSSKLIPGVTNMIGIRLPILRKLAKKIAKGNVESFLKQVQYKYFEEIMVNGFVIAYAKYEVYNDLLTRITGFLPHITNWSLCDSFCTSLKQTSKNKEEMYEYIRKCIVSDHTYTKRFAYVMLLDYYIEEPYLNDIFGYCRKDISADYYVKMAKAWLLSMCFAKYENQTKHFLEQRLLEEETYQKTLQKIIESNQISAEQKEWARNWKTLNNYE